MHYINICTYREPNVYMNRFRYFSKTSRLLLSPFVFYLFLFFPTSHIYKFVCESWVLTKLKWWRENSRDLVAFLFVDTLAYRAPKRKIQKKKKKDDQRASTTTKTTTMTKTFSKITGLLPSIFFFSQLSLAYTQTLPHHHSLKKIF